MQELKLPEPVFSDRRGTFTVTLYNKTATAGIQEEKPTADLEEPVYDPKNLLAFCKEPRSRKEIVNHLAIASAQYALRRYLDPLVESGAIRMTIPGKPKSPRQKYVTASGK